MSLENPRPIITKYKKVAIYYHLPWGGVMWLGTNVQRRGEKRTIISTEIVKIDFPPNYNTLVKPEYD